LLLRSAEVKPLFYRFVPFGTLFLLIPVNGGLVNFILKCYQVQKLKLKQIYLEQIESFYYNNRKFVKSFLLLLI